MSAFVSCYVKVRRPMAGQHKSKARFLTAHGGWGCLEKALTFETRSEALADPRGRRDDIITWAEAEAAVKEVAA